MFRSVRCGSRKFLHVRPPCSGRRTYGLLYLYLCTGGKRGNDQPFSGTASAVSYCAGEKYPGMADGVAAWTKHPAAEIGDTIRLFPHHLHGEGHFVAVLEKREPFRKITGDIVRMEKKNRWQREKQKRILQDCRSFLERYRQMMPGGCFFWRAAVSDAGTYAGNQTAACAASGPASWHS